MLLELRELQKNTKEYLEKEIAERYSVGAKAVYADF